MKNVRFHDSKLKFAKALLLRLFHETENPAACRCSLFVVRCRCCLFVEGCQTYIRLFGRFSILEKVFKTRISSFVFSPLEASGSYQTE